MARLRVFALAASVLALASVIATSSTQQALAVGSQIRTFVASTGSDANPCSRTAPCRTFAAALLQTANSGEIVALDTGGYGALTITQPVTVTAAPGVQAFIAPSSGAAITVNAGAGDRVILRNLQLNGLGASYGVYYQGGRSLHIESLSVDGFPHGIYVIGSGTVDVFVTDTVVRGSSYDGIYLYDAHAFIVRTRLEENFNGLLVGTAARASVIDTVAFGNTTGFFVSSSDRVAILNLERCTASGNSVGIAATSTSSASGGTVSNCTVTDNGTGILNGSGGNLYTRVNNTVSGNTNNGSFYYQFYAQ